MQALIYSRGKGSIMILVGTSGYSYKDWIGPFYPEGLAKKEWLTFYAGEFSTCEVNFTYYRMPDSKTLERMVGKTPEGFLFTVKAFQGITHKRGEADSILLMGEFAERLKPLMEAGKFGCVLAQLPYSFHANTSNRQYLERLREGFGDLPVVVEFRSGDWIEDRTYDELRALDLGFCCVDQPRLKGLVPPVAVATSETAYVRFHGRNSAKWWNHKEAWERYDYTYSSDELNEWVPKIKQLDAQVERTVVFANNHWQGQAVDTARQLRLLLGDPAP
jgi:uncharacterized protein YecE (DUF72 family)